MAHMQFVKFENGRVVDRFEEGCAKFDYRGYEVSMTTCENKPCISVFKHGALSPLKTEYGVTGREVSKILNYIELRDAKPMERWRTAVLAFAIMMVIAMTSLGIVTLMKEIVAVLQ